METIIERNVVLAESPAASGGPSAVSWAAVFAGATAAAAMSLILFILGIGLGLGAISPWAGDGVGGTALGVSTILWITLTSLVASGVGGYLTGRLRTRWLSVHTDEVYFRDTAHGFLAWGVATLLTAVIFTTTTAGIVAMGVKATAAVAGGVADTAAIAAGATAAASAGVAAGDAEREPLGYYLDALFRTSVLTPLRATTFTARPATAAGITPAEQEEAADAASTPEGAANLSPEQQGALSAGGGSPDTMVAPRPTEQSMPAGPVPEMAEVSRIFARAIQRDQLPEDDVIYVGRLVARHTGISAQDAEMRVRNIFENTQAELRQLETSARAAADAARAASAKVALWFFIALLAGAFIGSFSATIGGRQRDL